jgi:ABC-type transporter Mla MlaB component
MIVEDQAAPRRARVIGSLTGDAIQMLLDAVDRGVAVVDLAEVDQVDDAAVRVLAWLWPERCTIVDCPRWLDLWLRRIRGGHSALY